MKPVNLFQIAERNQVIVEVITSDRQVWVETMMAEDLKMSATVAARQPSVNR